MCWILFTNELLLMPLFELHFEDLSTFFGWNRFGLTSLVIFVEISLVGLKKDCSLRPFSIFGVFKVVALLVTLEVCTFFDIEIFVLLIFALRALELEFLPSRSAGLEMQISPIVWFNLSLLIGRWLAIDLFLWEITETSLMLFLREVLWIWSTIL